ncbi:MAG: DUF418 domain-containing protein [Phycisphaerae bacterium]
MTDSNETPVRPPEADVAGPDDAVVAHPVAAAYPALPPAPLAPVGEGERLEVIDALRGFALFGILIANIRYFTTPFQVDQIGYRFWSQPQDIVVDWLLIAFVYGKFYTLFSALFGFGMAIQMERAAARGRSFVPVYLRRLLVLLVMGLLHATLLWAGDILVTYAVMGGVLLLFRNRRPKTLLVWAGSLLVFMTLVGLTLGGLMMLAAGTAEGAAEFAEHEAQSRAQFDQALRVYASGSFGEVTAQRIDDLSGVYAFTLMICGDVLAMFLLGLYLARMRVLHEPAAWRRLLWRVVLVAGPLGLAANVVSASSFERLYDASESTEAAPVPATAAADSPADSTGAPAASGASTAPDEATPRPVPATTGPVAETPDDAWTAFMLVLTLGFVASPTLMLAYASAFVLVWLSAAGRGALGLLAAPGRMALTNYLTQSLVCSLLFYGYGLGLHGTIGPAGCMPIALALFAAQVVFSHAWLVRFRFGPMEWLWRSLTYGALQPMRRDRAA